MLKTHDQCHQPKTLFFWFDGIKEEPKTEEQLLYQPKNRLKCGWGPNCPFCKNQEKEDWDGNQPKPPISCKHSPNRRFRACPKQGASQTLNYQRPQNFQKLNQETSNDQYPSQSKIHKQWEAEMERLNAKYNLDCFSDSELDSESDEGEQYKYEHGYETLI